jgi:hypothetical protein
VINFFFMLQLFLKLIIYHLFIGVVNKNKNKITNLISLVEQ